jgi:hypothetical protein
MILTIIVTASFATNVVYAAKPSSNRKNTNKVEQKQEKSTKKISKEVYILSKRLDKIEDSYKKVNVKIEEYFSTTGSAITIGIPTETTTSSAVATEDPTETTTDAGTENDQDQSEEFENEYENEDSLVNNSFYGKLNAIMNRLNTVKRQLNRLNYSNSEAVSNLNSRTDELIKQVKESVDKVSNLQNENVKSLKDKLDKKVMEDQDINEQKKSWKIHFSRAINPETINSKNIMIVDSKNNIVDADVSYNQDSNNVIIEAKDGFIKSENYSILISSDVTSADGKKLQKTIEKRFSVE